MDGASDRTDPPLLAGRLALLERLGEGTFAEVWRVRDVGHAAAELALKIFRPEARGSHERPWSVVSDEARASLYVRPHPNVIRAHALLTVRFFGELDTPALLLDLASGPNLALWLKQQQGADPDAVSRRLAVLHGAIRGLAHVHAAGVAHRDLGFGNVLVSLSPLTGRLADFGAAAVLREGATPPRGVRRREPHAFYPPAHAAPELAFGHDVHAMATLCYLVLAERHPLTDEWPALLAGTWSGAPDPHLHAARRSLLELAPGLARQRGMARLSALLLRCVSAEPEERPRSGMELLRAWNEALGPGEHDGEHDGGHVTATAPIPGRAPARRWPW